MDIGHTYPSSVPKEHHSARSQVSSMNSMSCAQVALRLDQSVDLVSLVSGRDEMGEGESLSRDYSVSLRRMPLTAAKLPLCIRHGVSQELTLLYVPSSANVTVCFGKIQPSRCLLDWMFCLTLCVRRLTDSIVVVAIQQFRACLGHLLD